MINGDRRSRPKRRSQSPIDRFGARSPLPSPMPAIAAPSWPNSVTSSSICLMVASWAAWSV